MGKTTSTERMRKLRQRRKEEEDFDLEFHREKERKRVAGIRKKQKVRNINESKQEEYRLYERLRKRKQRERKRQDKGNIDGRIESNYKKGRSTRIKNSKDKENQMKRLHLKVKFVTNENRRLKRRLNSTPQSEEDYEASASCSESSFMSALSPSAKRRTTKRLSLSKAPRELVRRYHLDRQHLNVKEGTDLKQQIQKYLQRDDVSIVTPDIKKAKKGIRYRLASLQELHQRFQVDGSIECSYAQFTRYVPEHIVKPKPEDWGTCLNPELKLESIKKQLPALH